MPINYNDYPPNWKTEIRPRILERAGHRCELCGVKNHILILRGEWRGTAVYQDEDGWIYNASNSAKIGGDYVGEVDITGRRRMTKVVLTVAHLDHNPQNCADENLKALCQACHLRHDHKHHMEKARRTRERKAGLQRLF